MSASAPCNQVIVLGVGLIGGSVAAAVRRRWSDCRVTGIGRSPARLQQAQDQGLLHDWQQSIADLEFESDAVVVVCLPVDLIPSAVVEIAQVAPESALITDAGSVKLSIQTQVEQTPAAAARFVGAHPIAGSEQAGFEYADAELFVGRPCIVTSSKAGLDRERRCREFWQELGASVSMLDAAEHDRILALTSHLPHLMAAVTASCLRPEELAYAGTGFRDTTRVAAGDAELWQQILCNNRTQVLAAIDKARQALTSLESAVARDDQSAVTAFLKNAAVLRRQLQNPSA